MEVSIFLWLSWSGEILFPSKIDAKCSNLSFKNNQQKPAAGNKGPGLCRVLAFTCGNMGVLWEILLPWAFWRIFFVSAFLADFTNRLRPQNQRSDLILLTRHREQYFCWSQQHRGFGFSLLVFEFMAMFFQTTCDNLKGHYLFLQISRELQLSRQSHTSFDEKYIHMKKRLHWKMEMDLLLY